MIINLYYQQELMDNTRVKLWAFDDNGTRNCIHAKVISKTKVSCKYMKKPMDFKYVLRGFLLTPCRSCPHFERDHAITD